MIEQSWKGVNFPCGIFRRWFTETCLIWLWLFPILVNISLRTGSPSASNRASYRASNGAYPYFVKLVIFSILVFEIKGWLEQLGAGD